MILYANAGFYQFFKNMTSSKRNTKDEKYTVSGVGAEVSRRAYYLVADTFRKKDIYIKFDVYQRTDYEEIGVNTAENYSGFARIGTDNNQFPYVEFILKNKILYVNRLDKASDSTVILEVPHMEQYNNEVSTFELHIDTTKTSGFEVYELWINNILVASKKDENFLNEAQLMTFEVSHGMPSIINEDTKGYDEVSYFSNIIVADERLSNKKCMILPTKIVESTWQKNGDLFTATEKNQVIKQKIDMEALNKINPMYDNTKIDAIMCGSDVAYSEGYNSVVKFGISGTDFDAKTLANKKYYGVQSKVLSKNPATNEAWNKEQLEGADFTITSAEKTIG
jgi:hypothetical protein